jgi:hypothetical protein
MLIDSGLESQEDTILRHLRDVGQITSMEAIQLYQITRLSALIWRLREIRGFEIETVTRKGVKRRGRFGIYRLMKKEVTA